MGIITKITRKGNLPPSKVADGKPAAPVIPKVRRLAGVDAGLRRVEEVAKDVEKLREEY